jgi:trans-2,3-dihydro-3-hydroxyanthranilate isomerase
MKQINPIFGRELDSELVSQTVSLDESLIDDRFPIQEVSTGLPFIIIPLKTLEALKQAHVSKEKYLELIENSEAKALLVFCPETRNRENDFSVRVFADYYGVPEDPATGSANGCLAGYLVKHRYLKSERIAVNVEQGYEIRRPSLLHLRSEEKEGKIDIHVGGKVVMIAHGEFIS